MNSMILFIITIGYFNYIFIFMAQSVTVPRHYVLPRCKGCYLTLHFLFDAIINVIMLRKSTLVKRKCNKSNM